MLINVKMPTIVGILTFTSRKILYSAELSMEFFITPGPGLTLTMPKIEISYNCKNVDLDEVAHHEMPHLIYVICPKSLNS